MLKQRYAGMKIVVGRDKLDEVQGVRHKIQAFERFLEKYKDYQGKVLGSFSLSPSSKTEPSFLGGSDSSGFANYRIQ